MTSWANIVNSVSVNLQDIMSEEAAKNLKAKEDMKYAVESQLEIDILSGSLEDETTKTDAEIAKRLQQQFDKEYDENLKKAKEKLNGTSKVSVPYSNYRRASNNFDFECEDSKEDEEVEDIKECKDWDRFEAHQKEIRCIPRGYLIKNGRMMPKRDLATNNREGAGCNLKVYNKVSKHFNVEDEIFGKKVNRATTKGSFDKATLCCLRKMKIIQFIETVNSVIHTGKEKVILHASSGPQYTTGGLPREWAIKVFKPAVFKYIKNDLHFKVEYDKLNTKEILNEWVEKEVCNLLRLTVAGIPCPEVVGCKEHILVTSFIGRDRRPAPNLSNAPMNKLQYTIAYNQVVEQMKILYNEANLIHTNLSEHKILWFDGKCYFFDVRKAVEPTDENAFYFLMSDCKNITNFFKSIRYTLPDVHEADALFKYITGCDFENRMAPLKTQVNCHMTESITPFHNTTLW